MKIIKEINIPDTAFYDMLIDSVLYDIYKQTGKKITKKQLSGFKFERNNSNNQTTVMEVIKNIENEAYHFKTSNEYSEFVVNYDIEAIDQEHCRLQYTEETKDFGTLYQINNFIMRFLFSFSKKKQFKKMLNDMENKYQQDLENSV